MNIQAFTKTKSGKDLFKNILIPQRNKFIVDQCQLALKRIGQRAIDTGIVNTAIVDTQKLIEKRYGWYSLDEIEEVFKLGGLGEIGDNNYFSSKTVAEWFRNYHNDERRRVAKKAKEMMPKIELPERSQKGLTEKEVKEYAEEMRSQYHSDRTIFTYTFDLLEKYGIISLTITQKWEYMEKAKPICLAGAKENVSKGKINIKDYAKIIGGESNNIQNCAKRLVLIDFFEDRL